MTIRIEICSRNEKNLTRPDEGSIRGEDDRQALYLLN